jgi:hypothetical protein
MGPLADVEHDIRLIEPPGREAQPFERFGSLAGQER